MVALATADPVRSCGSSEEQIFAECFALVDVLLDADNESEAQASYLPAKARAESAVLATDTRYLLANQVRSHRTFRRWQAGF